MNTNAVTQNKEPTGNRPGPKHEKDSEVGCFPYETLHVVAWPDPLLEKIGHDPLSKYVETFWLPLMGPSCLLLVRLLSTELGLKPEGFDVDCAQLAKRLGIGARGGTSGPLWRTIERSARFGLTKRRGNSLEARLSLSPLTRRQVSKLPSSLRELHRDLYDTPLANRRHHSSELPARF